MSRLLSVLALSALLVDPALAQTEQRTVKGPTVAIYNLAGRLRAGSGSVRQLKN